MSVPALHCSRRLTCGPSAPPHRVSRASAGIARALNRSKSQPRVACQCSQRGSTSAASREELLHTLSSLSPTELTTYVNKHTEEFALSFFEWLASREDQLEGSDKVELGVLAGQIMAIKEGLEPLSFDAVAEELQQHWQATQTAPAAQPQTLPSAELSTHSSNTNSQASSDATTSDQALVHDDFLQSSFQLLQPFSDAGIARQSSQVRLLSADIKQARANSTVQVIGRKDMNAGDSQDGPQSVSNAAHRILEYLLQLQSAELRREVLPDAFQSPAEQGQEGYDESSESSEADNEQLSTTPLQLLQAIDLEVSRLSRGTSGLLQGQTLLPGGNPTTVTDVEAALHQLRQDVLDCWEGE